LKLFIFLFLFCISTVNARAPDGTEEVNCLSLNKNHKNYRHHVESCEQIIGNLKRIKWSWQMDDFNNTIDLTIYTPDFNTLCYLNIFNSSGQSVRKFKLNRRTYYPNQEFTEMIFAPSLSSFINQAAGARLEPCEYYAFLNYAGTPETPKKIDEQKKQSYSAPSSSKTTTSTKQTSNSLGKELLNKVFK
jgi:hypothetical protein